MYANINFQVYSVQIKMSFCSLWNIMMSVHIHVGIRRYKIEFIYINFQELYLNMISGNTYKIEFL